jgi:hypothetical protein
MQPMLLVRWVALLLLVPDRAEIDGDASGAMSRHWRDRVRGGSDQSTAFNAVIVGNGKRIDISDVSEISSEV